MYDPVSRYFAVSSARSVMASSAFRWFSGYGGEKVDKRKYNSEVKKEMDAIHSFLDTLPPVHTVDAR